MCPSVQGIKVSRGVLDVVSSVSDDVSSSEELVPGVVSADCDDEDSCDAIVGVKDTSSDDALVFSGSLVCCGDGVLSGSVVSLEG